MTGPDIGLGYLLPVREGIAVLPATNIMSAVALPNQADADLFGREIYDKTLGIKEGDTFVDATYQLPVRLDDRRRRLLKTTVTASLAGTPDRIDPEVHCLDDGECTLPVKMWAMNVNGGHNVAAGFSQERQTWVELTVEDLGKPLGDGLYEVVDCRRDMNPAGLPPILADQLHDNINQILEGGLDIDDLYTGASTNENGFPERSPRTLTQDQAGVLMNLATGFRPFETPDDDASFHSRICRGLSGHLMDKPHDETHEHVGDGLLDDEDVFLHRIGNTLPVVVNPECQRNNPIDPQADPAAAARNDQNINGIHDDCEEELLSWHIADVGFDYPERFCSNSELGLGNPCTGDELNQYPSGDLTGAANFKARVARADQFHIPGLNAFRADLTSNHLRAVACDDEYVRSTAPFRDTEKQAIDNCHTARGWLGVPPGQDELLIDLPVQSRRRMNISLRALSQSAEPIMRESVVVTSDERLEMLYPFPEFPGLVPHGEHHGERFGLVYITNIFYNVTGCGANGAYGDCEGPEEISFDFDGETHNLHAQVPYPMTYPSLPHILTYEGDPHYHFPLQGDAHTREEIEEHIEEYGFVSFMNALEEWQKHEIEEGVDVGNEIENAGTPYGESFTFIPFNSNHMPNNRSMVFYKPQRHYWDIRFNKDEVIGPLRVHIKVWFRHFPPEFLRLMARYVEGIYLRAVAEGKACKAEDLEDCNLPEEDNWFPYGPLVVEGDMAALYPNAASVDSLRRVLLDESIMHIAVDDGQQTGGSLLELPAKPSDDEVKFVLDNHCNPCHSDVLRHGRLILDYDDFARWDVKGGQSPDTNQDWTDNVVGVSSNYGNGMMIVDPGSAETSVLYRLLVDSEAKLEADGILSRPMPLKFDRMSDAEIEVVKRWIDGL
jgi:hypothetical protein